MKFDSYTDRKSAFAAWVSKLDLSLSRLGVKSISRLLLHRASDLKSDHATWIYDWLKSNIESRIIQSAGVSVYSPLDLSLLNPHTINLFSSIQCPLSIVDQRFTQSDILKELDQYNIKLEIRSIFLQGILLQTNLSSFSGVFSNLFLEHISNLQFKALAYQLSPLQTCLGYVLGLDFVRKIVIGCTTLTELKQIINTASSLTNQQLEIIAKLSKSSGWSNEEEIDPRYWKSLD